MEEDQYDKVEEEFWEHYDSAIYAGTPLHTLHLELMGKLRKLAMAEHWDAYVYEDKLTDAESVVTDITDALSANWENKKFKGAFWWRLTEHDLLEPPKEWTDVSPVSTLELDSVVAKYLDRPWMQMNRLDWYIINGFIMDQLLKTSDEIRSGRSLGRINWAYIFSGGKYMPMMYWQLGLSALKFTMSWLLLPVLAIVAYAYEYHDVGFIIGVLFALLVLFRLIMLPSRIMKSRIQKKEADRQQGILNIMLNFSQMSLNSTINPTLLRDKLTNADPSLILVNPAVYSILDRAIARDPAVLTATDVD